MENLIDITLIINAFNIMVKKEINIRFLKYCFNKRRGFYLFNRVHKLTKDEWDLLRSLITDRSLSRSLILK